MAEQPYDIIDDFIKNRSRYISWSGLANGDTGQPIPIAGHSDKTVHIYGTFGAGGTVALEGSNDPRVLSDPGNAVWTTMNDAQALSLSATSERIDMVIENPRFIRPNASAGDGTTDLTVILCARIIN